MTVAPFLTAGDRVVLPRTGRYDSARPKRGQVVVGTVLHVGLCGHPGCQFGDSCVTVREDGAHSTVNYPAADIRLHTPQEVQ